MAERILLSNVVSKLGYSCGDVDVLIRNRLATLGKKSGKTTVTLDVETSNEFLNQYHEFRASNRR